MPKTIPIALASDYAQEVTTLCICLKVNRADGEVFGFTTHDQAFTLSGVEYLPGFEVSSLQTAEGLAVGNLELSVIPDDLLPAADLLAGRWANARFEVFVVNYLTVGDSPGGAIDRLKRGTSGKMTILDDKFIFEFRGLTQALQQPQGDIVSKTCRARLGDAKCTIDLAPFTFTSTITAVTSSREFSDSARHEADDYFAEGELTFNDGDCADLSQKVKGFTGAGSPSVGTFTMVTGFGYTPEIGDSYTVIAGCRKRFEEDCRDKFDNAENFQGEPHVPGQDKLTKSGLSEDQPATEPILPPEGV